MQECLQCISTCCPAHLLAVEGKVILPLMLVGGYIGIIESNATMCRKRTGSTDTSNILLQYYVECQQCCSAIGVARRTSISSVTYVRLPTWLPQAKLNAPLIEQG